MMIQSNESNNEIFDDQVPRLNKNDMINLQIQNISMLKLLTCYLKKSLQNIQSLKVLVISIIGSYIAKNIDFDIFKIITADSKTLEFACCNCKWFRIVGTTS